VLAAPGRPLADLPMLDPGQRQQLLVEWNDTGPGTGHGAGRTVPEMIERRAAEAPGATALTCAGRTLSYGDLDRRANRLAHHLLALGVAPEDRVGLCLERSAEMVVAALAVMKAGAAYVPLDPAYPVDRLAYVLGDSGARVLVTTGEVAEALSAGLSVDGEGDPRTLLLDGPEAEAIAGRPSDRPAPGSEAGPEPAALAYLIYTSGSTGRPKGVEISHGALANFIAAMTERPGLSAGDTLVAVTTLSFDIAGLELYGPLAVGARVVVATREETADGSRLSALLEEERASVLQATPATWRLLLDAGWSGSPRLRALCGGEALPPALARALGPRVESLWNMYGPTETTIWSSTLPVEPAAGAVHVGGPIAGTTFVVLDSRWQPVPLGVPGELAIGGVGVARGYRRRPGLTAERFVPSPLPRPDGPAAGDAFDRLYRTGDLVRALPDGTFEFLGRLDHQVKVRGHRIELGEIEAGLAKHPAVAQAVAAVAGTAEHRRLVAYVVPAGTGSGEAAGEGEAAAPDAEPAAELDPAALREHLRRSLPDYMVPSLFVPLDALPLTPNGKVDRKALPEIGSVRRTGTAEAVAPRTETERRVAACFEELLEVEGIGARDDFFALGGHSLLLVELARRLRAEFGVDVPVVELFRHATVESLAAGLERWSAAGPELPDGVVRLRAGAGGPDAPPLFLVHPVSGELALYRGLVEALGDDRPVYGFQAHGFRPDSRPDDRVEAMATRYARALRQVHPEGPVLLAASSMGGLVAFEMARRLDEDGRRPALLALVDTPVPGSRPPRERPDGEVELNLLGYLLAGADPEIGLDALQAMSREERLEYLLRQGRAAGTITGAAGLDDVARVIAVVEANQAAMDAYRPEPWDGDLLYFRAADGSAAEDEDDGPPWSRLARGGVELHLVPGNHLSLHRPPHVERLAERLRVSLERAGRAEDDSTRSDPAPTPPSAPVPAE
jgi:amino acid adenylation domain-containing protein